MLDWSSVDAILDSFTVGNVDAVSLVFAHVTVVLRVTHTCRGDTLLAQVAIIVPAHRRKTCSLFMKKLCGISLQIDVTEGCTSHAQGGCCLVLALLVAFDVQSAIKC